MEQDANTAGSESSPQDELLERLELQAAAQHALHRGHARVGPPLHQALLHKPGEFALGEDGVDKGEAAGEGGRGEMAGTWQLVSPCMSADTARPGSHDPLRLQASSPRIIPDVDVRQARPHALLQLQNHVELPTVGGAGGQGRGEGGGERECERRQALQSWDVCEWPASRQASNRLPGTALSPPSPTCASRSLYSLVRSACVTPSNESTKGQAKS